ncbi:hypothetical protein BT96DRAFT_991821 [Gymnopus androsaceus JB14]|uniref:Uncharacterized protein n=1 Tax=Gymnopus androsaceus JB14 TaxID=1447944 RepID=A0A6A4HYI7_9AGAR|nr:hypothetical protein BT96DRAFT_991821 [Gymnopus androsaceus JB14]
MLYNWYFCQSNYKSTAESGFASSSLLDNIHCQTLFTNLPDEAAFYLCSARIELRSADTLAIMRSCMDELNNVSTFGTFGDNDHHSLDLDAIVTRLATYLYSLSSIINDLKSLLLDVRKGCNPEVYYKAVRPWFRGEDLETYSTSQSEEETGNKHKRKWISEGAGEYANLNMLPPDRELSGASAGQSSLIHALDHEHGHPNPPPSFMKRVQRYMPCHHCTFLGHLAESMNLCSLRRFVLSFSASASSYSDGSEDGQQLNLREAYKKALMSLKEFRDAHMVIATLYIIGPSRRACAAEAAAAVARGYCGSMPANILDPEGQKKKTILTTSTAGVPVSMTATPSKSDTGASTDTRVMKVAKSTPTINSEQVVKGTGGTDLV